MLLPDKSTRKFADLYNEYYPVVYSCAYSKIRDSETAKDLTQEVFTRFISKINELEHYRPWLLTTLKFVIFEHYRKNSGSGIDIEEMNNDITMSFVNGFRDSRIMITEALDNMDNFGDERAKVLFDLISIYNYTYKEAGAHLGMSERQVRYSYTQTTNKILDYFKSRGIKGLEDLL